MPPVLTCPTCARPIDSCVCAGTAAKPAKPVPVDGTTAEALARAEATAGSLSVASSFVGRRSVQSDRPAWGTAGERAHLAGDCDPKVCRHCATAALMHGDQTRGADVSILADVTSGRDWVGYCTPGCLDDQCRAAAECAWPAPPRCPACRADTAVGEPHYRGCPEGADDTDRRDR